MTKEKLIDNISNNADTPASFILDTIDGWDLEDLADAETQEQFDDNIAAIIGELELKAYWINRIIRHLRSLEFQDE